jgi:hypothetical protein
MQASKWSKAKEARSMIDGFPLSFFLPLVVHALAGLMTGVTGIMAFRAPKRPGRHHRWGTGYVWAYWEKEEIPLTVRIAHMVLRTCVVLTLILGILFWTRNHHLSHRKRRKTR